MEVQASGRENQSGDFFSPRPEKKHCWKLAECSFTPIVLHEMQTACMSDVLVHG